MNLYYITVCIGVNNKLLVLVLVRCSHRCCRRSGCRRFGLSPSWMSPTRLVADLTSILVRDARRDPSSTDDLAGLEALIYWTHMCDRVRRKTAARLFVSNEYSRVDSDVSLNPLGFVPDSIFLSVGRTRDQRRIHLHVISRLFSACSIVRAEIRRSALAVRAWS